MEHPDIYALAGTVALSERDYTYICAVAKYALREMVAAVKTLLGVQTSFEHPVILRMAYNGLYPRLSTAEPAILEGEELDYYNSKPPRNDELFVSIGCHVGRRARTAQMCIPVAQTWEDTLLCL